MKTYDCFMFFNELDLLEIRLQEMWDVTDTFVIAEANVGHSGKPKNYILLDNWERFKPYADKIKRIEVDNFPSTAVTGMDRDRFQRASLARGLTDVQPDDLVIISDLDEIPRAEIIKMIKEDENDWDKYILYLPMFQFRLNYMKIHEVTKGVSVMVTRGRAYTNPQQEREYTFPWIPKPEHTVFVEHGGWHFSYFGDDAHAVTKIKNFAHTETDIPRFTENLNIELLIRNKCGLWGPAEFQKEKFEYVVVDEYFPKCITDNIEKWKNMIVPNAAFNVTDLYREDR